MKFILNLFLLFFILSCSSEIKSTKVELPPLDSQAVIVQAVTPTPLPTVVVTPTPLLPIDDDFKGALKPLWDGYFKEDFSETRNVDILIVSNRKIKNGKFGCTDEHLGVVVDNNSIQYGVCKINVPKNHTIGQINIAKNNRQSSHDFFKVLNSRSMTEQMIIDLMKKTKRIPLVFVHGFNVRFQEAVLRAAQIAYDIKYQGPVLLFSWPAGAGDGFFDENMINRTYENNTKNAIDSVEPFKKFLTDLKNNDLKINLVVHSMGHQVVLPALKMLGETVNNDKPIINELILNAPDYEASEFTRLTDIIKKVVSRITLYCSFNDKAMIASKSMNKNERLGACTYSEDVDSINVSLVDSESLGLGHSYYSSRAILSDVFQVLMGLDVEKRLFIIKSEPNSTEKYFLRP